MADDFRFSLSLGEGWLCSKPQSVLSFYPGDTIVVGNAWNRFDIGAEQKGAADRDYGTLDGSNSDGTGDREIEEAVDGAFLDLVRQRA